MRTSLSDASYPRLMVTLRPGRLTSKPGTIAPCLSPGASPPKRARKMLWSNFASMAHDAVSHFAVRNAMRTSWQNFSIRVVFDQLPCMPVAKALREPLRFSISPMERLM